MPKTARSPRRSVLPMVVYSDALAVAICRDVEEGVPLPEAFLCNGVAAAAGEGWREERAGFAHELDAARARYVRSLIREVREAVAGSGARHDWRASLALLERADGDAAPAGSDDAGQSAIFTPVQMAEMQARRRAALGR